MQDKPAYRKDFDSIVLFIENGKKIGSHPEFVQEIEDEYMKIAPLIKNKYERAVQKAAHSTKSISNQEIVVKIWNNHQVQHLMKSILEKIKRVTNELASHAASTVTYRKFNAWKYSYEFNIDDKHFFLFGPKFRELQDMYAKIFELPHIDDQVKYEIQRDLLKYIRESKEHFDTFYMTEDTYKCSQDFQEDMKELTNDIYMDNELLAEYYFSKYSYLLENDM